MASITIKDMSVSYNKGKTYVIEDMSLKVNEGEFCVFLGPSGCGKTTAMHCIAGLLKPQKGEIYFGDKIVTAPLKGIFEQPQERNIAMVFQEYALYPNMTVRKNMSFALENQEGSQGRALIAEWTRWLRCCPLNRCLTESPRNSPVANASV